MLSLPEKLKLYEVLPYLSLPSNKSNKTITLWDYKQRKNLALFFHHGFSCPHCRAKLKEINSAYPRIQADEAEVLGISFDSLKDTVTFSEKEGIRFPLLSDLKGEDSLNLPTLMKPEKGCIHPCSSLTDLVLCFFRR